MSIVSQLILSLIFANIVAAIAAIILERRNPAASAAWVTVIFMLPVAGIVLFFLLSQNISARKLYNLSEFEEMKIDSSLENQINEIKNGTYRFSTEEGKLWQDMIHLNQLYGRAYYSQNNSVEFITDGRQMFDTMMQDIMSARETINIMFFIVKNDETGRQFIDALTQKAREGVEVRLLLDSMGSRQINDRVLRDFLDAGGKRAYFFPRKLNLVNFDFNYRNHRKLAVIDGIIGYTGGFNIAREYLGLKKKFGYWRDTHIRITGQSVQDINARFILDWRTASKEKIVLSEAFYSGVISEGNTGIQIVSSGPDSVKEEVKRSLMKMITSAERSIYVQTPYFVPDDSILESLKMAAQCGVDVRVMIPCIPDHPLVYWATYSYAGELVKSGGRVFIYENGFLHSKTMVVDGEVGTVGSANFDRRSFSLNFESNAFIYDKKEAQTMERIFCEDLKECRELTISLYENRSRTIKVKEVAARLLSDLL
ncbi:MAG: cardiolipin synthase [Clostridiales bacterium]|nr:cardiolipin synthase [Clostridiales bacterium]